MNKTNILTGVVMLETMWEIRQKDLLDLITPFINYAVSKNYSVNEKINIHEIISYIKMEFGYDELPASIIIRVFKRNSKIYQLKDKEYFLIKNMDVESKEFENRRNEVDDKLDKISQSLLEYLNDNCLKKKNYSKEESINALNDFFVEYGIYVGTNNLLSNVPDRANEQNYFVARFIIKAKEEDTKEYRYILDLIEGYFLKTAIYLQKDDDSLLSDYSKTTFVYDTPFLIDLLGYHNKQSQENALELHKMLKKRNANFGYFETIEKEINNILCAYKKSIGKDIDTYFNLDYFDERNFNTNDIDRIISIWAKTAQNNHNIEYIDSPEFDEDNKNIIDLESREDEIFNFIKNNSNGHYNENQLRTDIKTLFYVNRLRKNTSSKEIKSCPCVLVTTNNTLSKKFNEYYSNNICSERYQMVITDFELSSLVWVKSNQTSNLSETQLLKNAYSAITPSPELLKKYTIIYNKMNSEGKFTAEEAALLKSRRFISKEISKNNIVLEEQMTEETINRIVENIENSGKEKAKAEYDSKLIEVKAEYDSKLLEMENAQLEKNYKIAEKYSNNIYKTVYTILNAVLIAIIIVIGCTIIQYSVFINPNISLYANIVMTFFTIFSIIDAFWSKKFVVYKISNRVANRIKNYFFDKKRKELE